MPSLGGAGANANAQFRSPDLPQPINRPGVIYRVDPVTGRSSVFFDLNTVVDQKRQGALPSTGLVNWYDLAFDPEGYFDGRPSLFVSSVSQTDPLKNVVYRIAPDGSFMGLFIRFGQDPNTQQFNVQPSALLVPPVEQQGFLRGLFVGDASNEGPNGRAVLFFDANLFRPGQSVLGGNPVNGIIPTSLTLGPQVGLTAANTIYASPAYSAFTNFGLPPSPISQPAPGLSGVQGLNGELLIGDGTIVTLTDINYVANGNEFYSRDPNAATPDLVSAIFTPYRRLQDIAFDQYGYFSYGATVTAAGVGRPTIGTPTFAGSVFVTDLAQGIAVDLGVGEDPIIVPVQGNSSFFVQVDTDPDPDNVLQLNVNLNSTLGGRVFRIGPDGVVTPFATNFHVSSDQQAQSFIDSTLSLSFSADGTILYVSDMDGCGSSRQ